MQDICRAFSELKIAKVKSKVLFCLKELLYMKPYICYDVIIALGIYNRMHSCLDNENLVCMKC